MIGLWMTVAFAQQGAVFGMLQIPLTPSDTRRDDYHTLIKAKEAEGRDWASDTPGFECVGAGDYVELWIRRDSWPGTIPKKVLCTSGKSKATAKIRIRDYELQAMVVGDGTLVLPRLKGETAHYKGPGPRTDLVVGLGKSKGLGLVCRVKPGGALDISASGDLPDGVGSCTFRTPQAEEVVVPFVVRTLK